MEYTTKTIELKTLGGFTFKTPLPCILEYNNNKYVCASNDELIIVGCGTTEKEALKAFEGNLIGFVFGITVFEESRLSDQSKFRKELLKKYLDLDRYPKDWIMHDTSVDYTD